MIREISDRIRENWDSLFPDQPKPSDFYYVVESSTRVVMSVFPPNSEVCSPIFFIKFRRLNSDNDKERIITSRMMTIRELLRPELNYLIPDVLDLGEINGLYVHLETVLPGSPIQIPRNWIRRKIKLQRHFQAVLDCCFSMYHKLPKEFVSFEAGGIRQELLGKLVSHLTDNDRNNLKLLDKCFLRLDDWKDANFPLGWVYGDMRFANILISNNKVTGLVDWGGCKPDKCSYWDWIYFLFSSYLDILNNFDPAIPSSKRYYKVFDMLLGLDQSELGKEANLWVLKFLRAINIDKNILPLLLLYFAANLWKPMWVESSPFFIQHSISRFLQN